MNRRHPDSAKIHVYGRHFYVLSDILYEEFPVRYIQIIYIILNFDSVWLSALVVDQTLVKQLGRLLTKMLKNDEISKFSWNLRRKASEAENEYLRTSVWEKLMVAVIIMIVMH